MSSPPPPPGGRSLKSRTRPRRVLVLGAAAAALVVATAVVALVVSGGGASSGGQSRRAEFTTMVKQLRHYLASCNSGAGGAVYALREVELGRGSPSGAVRAARRAGLACDPATSGQIWSLSLYSVPASLKGMDLDYAVSCLGVWAQEDVVPAMSHAETLARGTDAPGTVSEYLQLAGWAAQNSADANAVLERAANRLGVTGFDPIRLAALAAAVPRAPSPPAHSAS